MKSHDCNAYKSASAKLLNRAISPDYLRSQTAQVAQIEQVEPGRVCSILIFRLGVEWLALPSELCEQILSPMAEHTLPHRSNATLLGIVNVRGQLLLKVSLLPVLKLMSQENGKSATAQMATLKSYRRMVVVSKVSEFGVADIWTFDVDEMYGIQAVPFDDLQPAAAGMTTAANTCTRYLFDWQGQRVSFLDDIKLFELIRGQAL